MDSHTITDSDVAQILSGTKVIALIGYSDKPERPSNMVAHFLKAKGYRVIPVNPGLAGQQALGETVVRSLAEIDAPVDMVDIFRASDAVPAIVEEAVTHLPELRTIWMQLGVISEDGAQRARDAGLSVVMDRCPKIEIPRLGVKGPELD